GCKYISVQGPPGTGKSHTITSIVFDAVLNNRSVLVLSDKKEALDVVESKITETLNMVRLEEDFQNPILRLGKTGNTYNAILNKSSVDKIRTHYYGVRQMNATLEAEIASMTENLKSHIKDEERVLKSISVDQISQV